ncbi:MAG TPA: DUF885 domain-containing protein [Bdellovibrionota bacterium]|jgi:uncharacterized protein (DUF885 family)|nr:DUF885 domain-containing protein [Bdellovibrionota bacterium]
MKTRLLGVFFLSFLLGAPAFAGGAADQLNRVIQDYTERAKRVDPYSAPYFNVEEDLGKFGDYPSAAYLARSKKLYADALEALKQVKPEALEPKDLRTYRLFKGDMEISLKRYQFPQELLEFNQMDNRLREYIDDSNQDLSYFPFDTVKHYDAFLERSRGFPAYIDRQIGTLKRGVKEGVVLSCVVAKKAVNTYQEALEPKVEKNPFFRPVGFMPKTFSAADHDRLEKGFRSMVSERILPSVRKFDHYFQKEYLPHCRQGYGLAGLPHGKEWYAYAVESGTNLALDPAEIHRTGLKEVDRIQGQIDAIQKEVGFKGTRAKFLESLSNDEGHFFKSSKEMFQAFLEIKKRVAPLLPRYFSLMPKGDYTIVDSGNPEDAAGSYHQPTESQPVGRFVVNTHNLKAVADYDVASLSLHEAVPGHHFQLALQFEMKDQLSEYQRKIYGSNSFVEGWALYSEKLGREMGAYHTPMERLGNLNSEMLRAVRLVVDTGIHAMGWSRGKALKYMQEHLAGDTKDRETEADRYSVWPGQALGYKVGELKILELRKRAEEALGPAFDIRDFHRVVIGNGTVSLGVLESQVDEWIASKTGGHARGPSSSPDRG